MFEENNTAVGNAFMSEMKLIKNHLRLPLVTLSASVHNRVKAYMATR